MTKEDEMVVEAAVKYIDAVEANRSFDETIYVPRCVVLDAEKRLRDAVNLWKDGNSRITNLEVT
jgi:hypothetical protein